MVETPWKNQSYGVKNGAMLHSRLHELPMQDHQAICKELNAIVHHNWAGLVSRSKLMLNVGNEELFNPLPWKQCSPSPKNV